MNDTTSPIDRMRATIGVKRGPSAWRTVTQEDVDAFARVSGDHFWIHTDPERAKRESPFGGPVAHGNLTLSMIDGFEMPVPVLSEEDVEVSLNIGWNRVRFPTPVPVGSRVRLTGELVSVEDKGKGWWEVVVRYTIEIEGIEKPACVADNVGRLQFTDH